MLKQETFHIDDIKGLYCNLCGNPVENINFWKCPKCNVVSNIFSTLHQETLHLPILFPRFRISISENREEIIMKEMETVYLRYYLCPNCGFGCNDELQSNIRDGEIYQGHLKIPHQDYQYCKEFRENIASCKQYNQRYRIYDWVKNQFVEANAIRSQKYPINNLYDKDKCLVRYCKACKNTEITDAEGIFFRFGTGKVGCRINISKKRFNELWEAARNTPQKIKYEDRSGRPNVSFWAYCVEDKQTVWFDDENLTSEQIMALVNQKLRKKARALSNALAEMDAPKQRRETISDEVRIFVWQRDGGKCVKCGGKEKLEYDHIIPVSKGGSNTERNLQILCENCNRSKHDSIV